MGTPVPSLSQSSLAHRLAVPRAFAQAGAPSLAAAHLAGVRLLGQLPAASTAAICCPACSTINSLVVRLVRSRRAKVRAKKTKSAVLNTRVLACTVCSLETRDAGSDRPTVNAFPSARKAARLRASGSGPVLGGLIQGGTPESPKTTFKVAPAASIPSAPRPATLASKVAVSASKAAGAPARPTPASSSSTHTPSITSSARASPVLPPSAHPPLPTAVGASPVSAPPPPSSSSRKKKPPTALQKMLALNKAREEAEAAAKKTGGGLLDWM